MRAFLLQLIVFLSPFLFFIFCGFLNFYTYKKQVPELENPNILIIGDSQILNSINPNLLMNAQNISQTAEPYFLSYWKIKKILKSYKPDTIIIGFSPHNISAYNDYKLTTPLWASEMFKRCYPIHNLSAIDSMIEVNYTSYYRTLIKQIAFFPKNNHIHYIGKFEKKINKKNNLNTWESPVNRHFYRKNIEVGISQLSINYLDSMISICKLNNITPILLRSPVHKFYQENIPDKILQSYENTKIKYQKI